MLARSTSIFDIISFARPFKMVISTYNTVQLLKWLPTFLPNRYRHPNLWITLILSDFAHARFEGGVLDYQIRARRFPIPFDHMTSLAAIAVMHSMYVCIPITCLFLGADHYSDHALFPFMYYSVSMPVVYSAFFALRSILSELNFFFSSR